MKSYTDKINEEANFPSQFNIGDPVYIEVQNFKIEGYVRFVGFTNAKVRYDVSVYIDCSGNVEDNITTFHNLDSIVVIPREGAESMDFDFDNHS